jgi:hypothetical protein
MRPNTNTDYVTVRGKMADRFNLLCEQLKCSKRSTLASSLVRFTTLSVSGIYSIQSKNRMTVEYWNVNYSEGSSVNWSIWYYWMNWRKPLKYKSLTPLLSEIWTQLFSNIIARQWFFISFRLLDNFRSTKENLVSFLPWRQRWLFT